MATPKDYYDTLGVPRNATADEIRKAYRKLARQHHPDVNKAADAAARFGEIQEAYEVLSDEEKRRNYDRFGHATPGFGGVGNGGSRPSGRQQAWSHVDATGGGFDTDDLSGIFEQMFGGRGGAGTGSPFGARGGRAGPGGSRVQPQRGTDLEHRVTITFMTAATGGTEELRLTISGEPTTISVKIPPGIEDGAKLRVRGKGQPGTSGGSPGDIILTVNVGQHPFFRREGLDLFVDIPITIAEAALGVTVTAPLLGAVTGTGPKSVQLKVPAGTGSGQKLRVRGKGLSDAKGGSGDYYAVVQIAAPTDLTEDDRILLAKLANGLKNPRESAPFADLIREGDPSPG